MPSRKYCFLLLPLLAILLHFLAERRLEALITSCTYYAIVLLTFLSYRMAFPSSRHDPVPVTESPTRTSPPSQDPLFDRDLDAFPR